jgi:hypothetical protein
MRTRRTWPLALALAAPLAWSGPYTLTATQTVTHESNVLRAETDAALPAGLSRADTVYTTVLQGGIDQPIGRQRVFGDASLRRTQFQHNGLYDSNGYRVAGGLDWQTVGRWSGSLNLSSQRSLGQLSNDEAGVLTHGNAERTRQADSALRWGVSTRLAAEATLNWRDVRFSAPEFASREFRQRSAYVGLRHGLAAWWSLGWRESRGAYPRFRSLGDGLYEADRFARRELELKAALPTGGASDLALRVGWGRTRYDNASTRDISGLYGSLDWTWRPSGNLRVQWHVSREPAQEAYFLNTLFGRGRLSYDRDATLVQLKADLMLSGKTSAYAAWGFIDRSLSRSIVLGDTTLDDAPVHDRTRQYALGLRWQPGRAWLLGLDLQGEERRDTTALSRPYHSTTISTFGQLSLP